VPGGTGGKAETMVRKLLSAGIALLTTGILIGVAANAASADPKPGELITLDCDALGTLDVAVNGNGLWSPGHVVDSTQVLVPYRFRFEFTPTGGGEPEVEEVAKRGPAYGRLDVCTFTIEEEDGTINGTVWISYTPT
jgi:hypothetical protein